MAVCILSGTIRTSSACIVQTSHTRTQMDIRIPMVVTRMITSGTILVDMISSIGFVVLVR